MAVRSATRRYADLPSFLREYGSTLAVGAMLLPAGTIDGEAAAEMKVDLMLPMLGRVGPIDGQVVARLPDGSTALRVNEFPPDVLSAFAQVNRIVEDLKVWLVESGQLAVADTGRDAELQALRLRVRDLESRPVMTRAAPGVRASEAPADGPRERGLAIPDVQGLDPALEGRLGDRSLRDALMELAIARATGLLTLELPDGRVRWGLWQKGGPVGWRAEPIDEQEVLGVLLFRAGQLTKEQLAQSIEMMESSGGRQGEALIEMGIFGFAQLVLLLQKQTEFVVQRVLREPKGVWSFHILEDLPEKFINPPLRVASLLFRTLRIHAKEMPAEELAGSLREWLDRYVFLAQGSERVFEEMKLTPEEQAFVKIIRGTSFRLRELFSVSTLSRTGTAGMVWALADLNLIEFREEEAAARIDERVSREVDGRMAALGKGTLFDMLDLHWICTGAEVEAAHKKLSDDFRPDRTARWGEKYTSKVVAIRESLERAYGELKPDTKRREYRASIVERSKIEQSAEMLCRKGELALMKETPAEAVDCYSKAAELLPQSAECREGLQRARMVSR